jgi:hypothetical protein
MEACFHVPFAANKWKLPFSDVGNIYIYIHIYPDIYIYAVVSNGKGKMEA